MILFFDIDGTLWDYKNYIPDSTKLAIKKAQENGHHCFINTGRARAFVHDKDLRDSYDTYKVIDSLAESGFQSRQGDTVVNIKQPPVKKISWR